jgi:hypothetical protein
MEKKNRLVETKLRNTIKKVVLKESKLITNDSELITEGKKIIVNFHKIKKRKLKEGYSKREINEDFTDWLKSLFTSDDEDETSNNVDNVDSESEDGEKSGTMKKTFVDSAAQWMIGFILEQLGVTGELNRILKIALSDIDIEDYPKLLDPVDNCKWLSDVLFDGIMEYIVQVASESMLGLKNSGGSIVSTSFSKAFANLTSNSQFKTDMKRYVSMAICDALGGQSGEFELSSELGRSDLDPEMVSGIREKL